MLPLAAEGSTLTRKKVLPVNDGHVEDCYRVLNLSMGNMDVGPTLAKKALWHAYAYISEGLFPVWWL
jgi:hypothetical protein